MKTAILTMILVLGMAGIAAAQKEETFTLRPGQQKRAGGGDVTLKFLRVIEDTRCPVGTNCIWSGNARLEVKITGRHDSRTVIINSTTGGPLGAQEGSWAITLTSLTPRPGQRKIDPSSYRAVFVVRRIQR